MEDWKENSDIISDIRFAYERIKNMPYPKSQIFELIFGDMGKRDLKENTELFGRIKMTELHIKHFIKEVGENNKAHGFRDDDLKPSDFVALIHSEVSEILEEFRSGRCATEKYYRENGKPEGVPFELADVVIRCFDMADYYGIDLENAIIEKHEFNKTRPYKHGKAF